MPQPAMLQLPAPLGAKRTKDSPHGLTNGQTADTHTPTTTTSLVDNGAGACGAAASTHLEGVPKSCVAQSVITAHGASKPNHSARAMTEGLPIHYIDHLNTTKRQDSTPTKFPVRGAISPLPSRLLAHDPKTAK